MLGQYLKAAREAAGMTQMDLATRLRVSQSKVSGIEVGRNAVGADDLSAWSSALQLTDEQRLEALRLAGLPRESVQPGAA